MDEDPDCHQDSEQREEHKDDKKPDEVFVVADANAIVEILAVVVEILGASVAGHAVVG